MIHISFWSAAFMFAMQVLAMRENWRLWRDSKGYQGHGRDFLLLALDFVVFIAITEAYVPLEIQYFAGNCSFQHDWQRWVKYGIVAYYAVRLFIHGRLTKRHEGFAAMTAQALRSGRRGEARLFLAFISDAYWQRWTYAGYVFLAVVALLYVPECAS